ncbi:MAG: transaldolase [Acidimicrobiales bacterium]
MTRLHDLYDQHGQSPWIDNIRRDWLDDGTLASLVSQGVRGVTSNPSIFAKSLASSSAYDAAIAALETRDPEAVFESLAVADVRDACDVLGAVHLASRDDAAAGRRRYADGFVSLEVSPRLAHDTAATIAAARRLADRVDRPNVMIKIPATREGLAAITEVLGQGINVNVTLIFSTERYGEVIDAWRDGLSLAASRGHDLAGVASVASFFVSRLDVAIDAQLAEGDPRRGTNAVAQTAAAYEIFRARRVAPDVTALIARGAQIQRPLWASTSTKDPHYDDLLYVNDLVADETVNTMPDATLRAALDRLDPTRSVLADPATAARTAHRLDALGSDVDLDQVTRRLEDEGVAAFADAYDALLATIAAKIPAPPRGDGAPA